MILAAGLLVLLGLGLFVGGLLTGATELYWSCVAACVAASGLLFVVRRQLPRAAPRGTNGRRSSAAATEAAATRGPAAAPGKVADPPVEEVEVTDLLLVVDLTDEVLVIDEQPRYHLPGCPYLPGRTTIPLPVDEARSDGFTPCAACEPDRNLAERARARRTSRGG